MNTRRSINGLLVALFTVVATAGASWAQTYNIEKLMRELQIRKVVVGVGSGTQAYIWPTATYDNDVGSCSPGPFPVDGFYKYAVEHPPTGVSSLAVLAGIASDADLLGRFGEVVTQFLQEEDMLEQPVLQSGVIVKIPHYGYEHIDNATEQSLQLSHYAAWHFADDTDNRLDGPYKLPTSLNESNIVGALEIMNAIIEKCKYVEGTAGAAESQHTSWSGDCDDLVGVPHDLSAWLARYAAGGSGTPWTDGGGSSGSHFYMGGNGVWDGGDGARDPAWASPHGREPPNYSAKRRRYQPASARKIDTEFEIFCYINAQPTDSIFLCPGDGLLNLEWVPAPLERSKWKSFRTLSVPNSKDSESLPATDWDSTFGGSGDSSSFDIGTYISCTPDDGDPNTIDDDVTYEFNASWDISRFGVYIFSFSPPTSTPCGDDDEDPTYGGLIDDEDSTSKDAAGGAGGPSGCGGAGGPGAGSGAGAGLGDLVTPPGAGAGDSPDLGGVSPCAAVFPATANCSPRSYTTDMPVEYRNGFKFEQTTDLTVAVEGPDFSLVRHYTGSPGYVSNVDRTANGPSLVGEGWSLSAFMYLVDNGDTLALRSWPATVEYLFSNPSMAGDEWRPIRTAPYTFKKSCAWIDGEYWPTWELSDPGHWSLHFVREFDYDAQQELGFDWDYFNLHALDLDDLADRYGRGQDWQGFLVGSLLMGTDPYGHERVYEYHMVTYTRDNDDHYAPRLKVIHLNGSPLVFGDADVEFDWLFDSSRDGAAIFAQLDEVRVVRQDAEGARFITQRVDYTYGSDRGRDDSDDFEEVAAVLAGDVAYNDTQDESSELVQVTKFTMVDGDPESSDVPYRVQITQYRYHDGEEPSTTGDPRLDAYGLRSQLKSVIMPQQIEYYAEHRTGVSWTQAKRVQEAALELLTMDDDDQPTGWDAGSAPMVVDLASKVVGYSTTGLVETQYLQASCGCGGGGQSVRLSYQLEHWTAGSDDGTSLVITEAIDEGTGFEDYRRHFYDMTEMGDFDAAVLTSQATEDLTFQGQGSLVWAEAFVYDNPATLLPTKLVTSAAVTAYSNASLIDGTAPAVTTATGAGLVLRAEYDTNGLVTAMHRREGTAGSDETLYEIDYGSGGDSWRYPVEVRRFRVTGSSSADDIETTTYAYQFYAESDGNGGTRDSQAVSAVTVAVEAELPAENGPAGSGVKYETITLFDRDGMSRWMRHPDGTVDYVDYDKTTGGVVTVARNVDPTGQASGSPNPPLMGGAYGGEHGVDTSGWGRYEEGGFAVSARTYDLLGRLASSTSPTGVTTYVVRDIAEEDVSGSDVYYYRTLRFPHLLSDDTVDGPIAVSWQDAAGKTIRSSGFGAVGSPAYDPPTADDVDWATELSRSTATISSAGLVMSTSRWLDLDVAGRVAETEYEYDALGRRVAVTDPNGTVRRTVFDVLNRPIESYVGDGTTDTLVQELFYDSGSSQSHDYSGNSNLTVVVQHTGEAGAADERVTIYSYDWRNRRIATLNPESPHQAVRYDNLDRVTASAVYSTLPYIDSDGVDIDEEQHRGAYSETLYSQRGLPYRSRVAIDPSQTTLAFLQSDTWYDASGRQLASDAPNGPASVTEYDGLGRAVRAFVTDRAGDTASNGSGSFEDILDLTDDHVIEESTITFRDDTLPELAYTTKRTHNDTSTGEIGLDDGITTFTGSVYDDAARIIATINWGTNADGFEPAGSTGVPTVPSTVPDRDTSPWDEAIITEQSYNARGLVETTTDPEGTLTAYLYDDANRRVAVVENYQSSNGGSSFGFDWDATNGRWEVTGGLSSASPDVNRVTSYTHDLAGNVKYQTAHLPPSGGGTEDVQVTEYVYGVTAVTSNPTDTDSLITSDSLLKEVRYPDESTGEPGSTAEYKVSYAYNRLGELRSVVDQNGTTHLYSRDDAGRATLDWVSAFGTDVDGQGADIDDTVNGIGITYDDFGRVQEVQSLDSQSGVLNGVKFGYNSLWQVEDVFQDPNSAVTESGGTPSGDTLVVRYTYSEDATNNHSRITGMTYPDGSVLAYTYDGSNDNPDDAISRVTKLSLDSTDIVVYDYVGLGMFAEVDYAVPDIQLDRTASHDGKRAIQTYSSQTAGLYPAWDRFGRVIRHMWVDGEYDELSPNSGYPDRPPLLELTHSYDRASNRLTRYDERPGAQMPNWDFEYDYDDLDRLVAADRGEVESGTFTSGIGVQEWTLDMLGNWSNWKQDLNGDGDFGDNQEDEDRDHNAANEITSLDIQGLTGTPFTQYRDKAGNWTRNRRSNVSNLEYTHDAWNRLVKVRQLGTIPASTQGQYEYNGLHWRTVKLTGTAKERRMFYSASWQLLEERYDSDTTGGFSEEECSQTVWGLRYIDDAVLRRTDTDQDHDYADAGERTDYYLTDPQFSVVAVVDDTGALQERVAYSAYGEARHHFPADMNGDGDVDSGDSSWFSNINNLKDIDEAGYNPDGDLNRDGSVDAGDVSIASGWNGNAALAKGLISDPDGPGSPIGYDGYVFNAETKLYTVRFRHYEPVTGRWIERDPAGFIDGMNLMEYVGGAVINAVDPSGLVLIVEGSQRVRTMVQEALNKLCPGVVVNDDGSVTVPERSTEPQEGESDPTKEECDSCDNPPACDILRDLINSPETFPLVHGDAGYRYGWNPDDPAGKLWKQVEVNPWRSTLRPKRRDDKGRLKSEDRRAAFWEILWHELIHAQRSTKGLHYGRYGKSDEDFDALTRAREEVDTILAMNEFRDWYNKCGDGSSGEEGAAVPIRDPFGHDLVTPAWPDIEKEYPGIKRE